jgi:putative hydrolase of HD superfamily
MTDMVVPSGSENIFKIRQFIDWFSQLHALERQTKATPARQESDAEHSWHLAMLAWSLHGELEAEFGVRIDIGRVIKMCLMHDLVEIDVGDVDIWDEAGRADAETRENEAAENRFRDLPHALGEELMGLWRELGDRITLEAQVAYAVDRLAAPIMRLQTGHSWKLKGITVVRLDSKMLPPLRFSQTLTRLYGILRTEALSRNLIE